MEKVPKGGTQETGRKIVKYMMSFPVLVSAMWAASPNNFHWYHCYYCISFGVIAWTAISIYALSGRMCYWQAIVLIIEFGYGLVAVTYMLLDSRRTGTTWQEIRHSSRCLTSIPGVLMGKQLGRTAVDMTAGDNGPSVWWHFYVDVAQVAIFCICGCRSAVDMGEMWLIIYTTVPVVLGSYWTDTMALRVRTLLRANSRLMQTAFASVVCVDRSGILESSSGFDALVGGNADGLKLDAIFAAERKHLDQLCSPAADSERVVRRLRTTLVSLSKSFQQDVEVRVLSATELEMQSEKNLLLGVAIMGERRPFSELEKSNTSFILEQQLHEVGHARVARDPVECVPEEVEVTSFDSISLHREDCNGRTQAQRLLRRKQKRGSHSSASSISSDLTSTIASHQDPRLMCAERKSSFGSREEGPAYGLSWKESSLQRDEYLKECSFSTLEDLMAAWNHSNISCCHWHNAVSRLSELVAQMRSWRSCSDEWPLSVPCWQCASCSALQFDNDDDGCWLCLAPGEEASLN